jgi:NADH-quinone oxidoreductase subunit L
MNPYLPYICLLLPLFVAIAITLGLKENKKFSVLASISACLISFLAAIALFLTPPDQFFGNIVWLNFPGLQIEIGCIVDHLTRLMLLVVTGVGFFIHLFAYGYMKEDPGLARFFAKLSLFMFSMIGIVLANNLIMMFMFWELVGLSSYLLIGFWFERPSAAEAAKKAFLVNRIGDFGFMIGILLVWQLWGTINFAELEMLIHNHPLQGSLITFAVLGLFCGCMGKSAQFPLHVWLPDAMEGPTPVSALIHAATMVAAGVYMLSRVYFILALSPFAMHVIAWIGGFTALFAALIALQQNDIKRILAYSTLSQLGYMVMAVGLGAWASGMFHLTTHAFFKALLFLGAGSVIHGLHHEQNIWKMGGVFRKMKITSITFFIGTAALMGIPFFSGFYSKEGILFSAYHNNKYLFIMSLTTVILTCFYMTRLIVVAFFGKEKSHALEHAHESPPIMTVPLIILSILSIMGGWLGIDIYLTQTEISFHEGGSFIIILSFSAILLGAGLSWILYRNQESEPYRIPFLLHKFYIDELYEVTFLKAQSLIAHLSAWTDQWIVEGIMVRLSGISATMCGEVLRLIQGGNLKAYIFFFILGALLLFYKVFLLC